MGLGAGAEIKLFKENAYFSINGKAEGIANAELLGIGWQTGQDFNVYFMREEFGWIYLLLLILMFLAKIWKLYLFSKEFKS